MDARLKTVMYRCRFAANWLVALVMAFAALGLLSGCASPGPPHAPSLQVPAHVRDLAAVRRDGDVDLRVTLPRTTTDNQPLKASALTVMVCRGVDDGPCVQLAPAQRVSYPATQPHEWRDALPPDLKSGQARLLEYRVRLANTDRKERLGEWSAPVLVAGGQAPPPVADLRAQGSRLGVVLTWQAADDGDSRIVLHREGSNTSPSEKPGSSKQSKLPTAKRLVDSRTTSSQGNVVLLDAGVHGASTGASTLDTTAVPEELYRYSAERVRAVTIKGHNLELRSSESLPITFTLHDVFPPPAPVDLSVAGFEQPAKEGSPASYSVDLIWKPVDDPALSGYNVYRQTVDSAGRLPGERVKLNREPIVMPAFRDIGASTGSAYVYTVTAVDHKGNESAPVTATLSAQARQ